MNKVIIFVLSIALGMVCGSPLGKTSSEHSDEPGIHGGTNVPITKYPYIVHILNQKGNLWATGAILNENWILTTGLNAWALDKILIRAGSIRWDKGGQLVTVANKTIHQNYTFTSWSYNVAVMKLEQPLKFNKKVEAVELGSGKLKPGTVGVVTGHDGSLTKVPTHLKAVKVTRDTDANCKKVYESFYDDTVFCTKSEMNGPCVFDFGDPLVVNGKLVGLYGGVDQDCTETPTSRIYTNIPQFVDWINDAIKS